MRPVVLCFCNTCTVHQKHLSNYFSVQPSGLPKVPCLLTSLYVGILPGLPPTALVLQATNAGVRPAVNEAMFTVGHCFLVSFPNPKPTQYKLLSVVCEEKTHAG